MTSCRQVYQHICDHLDEDLSSARCRRIRQHLEECPDCMAYLDSLKKTIILYKSAPVPAVPLRVHKALARALEHEHDSTALSEPSVPRSQTRRSRRAHR